MAQFTLMRHGEAAFAEFEHRSLIGGCRDWIPLSARGVQQVQARARGWRAEPFELILASPMSRALHTAAIVSRVLDLPLRVEFDLHEWLPDLTFRFESFDPVQQAIDDRKRCGNEWPTGESRTWEAFSQVRTRAMAVLERYASRQSVLVACHHTLIEALTGQSLGYAESVPFPVAATAEDLSGDCR
jgi:broad specificity phosphatase PhoE